MANHTEQLVGTLFRVLSEEGHPELQQALLEVYQSQATTDRGELTENLFSELVAILHEHVETQAQIEILTTAVERLLSRLTAIVDAAPVAMLVVDADNEIQVWNDGAERIFGWSDSEVRRRSYGEVLGATAETTEILTRLQNGKQLHGVETQHVDRHGTRLDVRIWAAPVQTHDTESTGGVCIVSDITAQKQREQRLAVLNRVLRHNIRNDVNVLQAHLDMLAEEYESENDHIQVMEKRITNIVELSQAARNIEQLKDDETEQTIIELGPVLQERAEQLRVESPAARVSCEVPGSLPVVAHELLPYAFDNVLDNAIEHNSSAQPTVSVSAAGNSSRNRVTVKISDNGPGLPSTEREVLTADTETALTHSSGLGLWLTRWIVRSSDGSITVEESSTSGTTISVCLRQAG
ncbi:PAS domain S-box protein [Halovenus salina]|uniref:PAS domain S-box protein n=1 Tax=Halovenus salina TaxID=1510225 RepID=UPI0022608C0F|nr:PAS domain S-box protein [Halovenus salina]